MERITKSYLMFAISGRNEAYIHTYYNAYIRRWQIQFDKANRIRMAEKGAVI